MGATDATAKHHPGVVFLDIERYLAADGFVALRTATAVHLDERAGDAAGTPYQHEPQSRWRRHDPASGPDPAAVLRAALYRRGAEPLFRRVDWRALGLHASFYPATPSHPVAALAVARADTSKGAAAAWLRRRLGLDGAPTLSVGDGLDDCSLFALGQGVAPADAHPEVRAAADWIAPGCDHGAVAAALERFGFAPAAPPAALPAARPAALPTARPTDRRPLEEST